MSPSNQARFYFGDRKVFLGSIPGVDLAVSDWRQLCENLRRAGLIEFARADLVAAMDPELVARSEWSQGGATDHFLVVA